MKIYPVGSRAVPYGRTDMTKLIVAFRNFSNSPKNRIFLPVQQALGVTYDYR